jgi:hypothetical protein
MSAAEEPDDNVIPFDPVPSRANRRNGWTEARQRAFIAALARCGSVAAAARQVGKSVRGLYALRERPGAEGFCAAWDEAAERGVHATLDNVIDRAMHGGWVPVVRRGRIVRMEFRHFDRLAIAILSGRGRDIEENRAERARIRAYRRSLKEEDRRRAEVAAAHEKLRQEIAQRAEEKNQTPPPAQPRIRML